MKKRILFVGEASSLNSGFSTIYRELLPRICERYDIAEIASYVTPDDPKQKAFVNNRWKWWGTMPRNKEEAEQFSKPSPYPEDRGANINQFGYAVFDRACIEFQPDIVVSIRDVWMDSYIARSPFRSWFKWVFMPTIDCQYQAEEWIDTMSKANLICSYSDFGIETLRIQAPGLKVFKKPLRPGVDLDTFKVLDSSKNKEEFIINPNIKVIGSVFRNQSRKRVLDLIDSFAIMKNKYKGNNIVDKSVLLLHSCWPDNQFSFDYPRHIMRLSSYSWVDNHCPGLKNSVLQTLKCHACGKTSLTFAANLIGKPIINNTITMPCTNCGQNAAAPPNVGNGLSREELAKVYNLMDLLVQFSISEGCFAPDTEITTDSGLRAIKDIQVGDIVLTHKGDWQPVHKVHINNNPGCMEIQVYGDSVPVIGTVNHEVFTQNGLKRIDNLTTDDYLIRPIDRCEISPDELIFGLEDDSNIMTDGVMHHISKRYSNGYPTNTTVNSIDLGKHAYFVGGFLAEGFIVNDEKDYTIGFALCDSGDEKLEESFYNFAKDVGCKVRKRHKTGTHGIELTISSPSIKALFKKIFGTHAHNKKIPHKFMTAPLGIQAEIIAGYFDGDGCLEKPSIKNNKKSIRKISTVSRTLAQQYRDILLRLGIVSNHYFNALANDHIVRTYGYQSFKFDNIIKSVKTQKNNFSPLQRERGSKSIFIKNDILYTKIKNISTSQYAGPVYNITVGTPEKYTSSYCLYTIAVKNCGMPVQEAKACGVPVLLTNYSAFAEKGSKKPDYKHLEKIEDYTVHLGGELIDVDRYYIEPETSARRALTSIEDGAEKMFKLITSDLTQMKLDARKCVEDNYDWNKNVKDWEFVLDNIKSIDRDKTWNTPTKEVNPLPSVFPDGLSDSDFVDWLYLNVLCYDTVDTANSGIWVEHLKRGTTRKDLFDHFLKLANKEQEPSRIRDTLRKQILSGNKESEWL